MLEKNVEKYTKVGNWKQKPHNIPVMLGLKVMIMDCVNVPSFYNAYQIQYCSHLVAN